MLFTRVLASVKLLLLPDYVVLKQRDKKQQKAQTPDGLHDDNGRHCGRSTSSSYIVLVSPGLRFHDPWLLAG